MAKKSRAAGGGGASGGQELLTLTEVSKRTGISMPTLQKYKKNYQSRIPSKGQGRTQRYPVAALAVFEELKRENMKRRGRPRKKAGAARKRPARTASGGEGLLSLAEIGRRTGISYPTLLRYVAKHGKDIPHTGKGRKRRYPPAAVAVFEELRGRSRRGPKRKAPVATRSGATADPRLAARVAKIESMQADLAKQLDEVVAILKQPLQITIRPE